MFFPHLVSQQTSVHPSQLTSEFHNSVTSATNQVAQQYVFSTAREVCRIENLLAHGTHEIIPIEKDFIFVGSGTNVNGLLNGVGILISQTGNHHGNLYYDGTIQNGFINGGGRQYTSHLDIEGIFQDAAIYLIGAKRRFPDGRIYEGQLMENDFSPALHTGRWSHPDGSYVDITAFNEGLSFGKGVFIYSNYSMYEGEGRYDSKNGHFFPNGDGKMIFENGDVLEGLFISNEIDFQYDIYGTKITSKGLSFIFGERYTLQQNKFLNFSCD